MLFSKPLRALTVGLSLATGITARAVGANGDLELFGARDQDIVTWDDHSIFINGERVMIFSGEFHAFRLPVLDLRLDVFQKIKASGYNAVSIYIDWHLLEAEKDHFRDEGIFAVEPVFQAAQKAGLYVLARPGPYINAEVSGGGFPGWMTKIRGALRTSNPNFINSTDYYISKIGEIVAKSQITEGGNVILFQPENEYQHAIDPYPMPEFEYWDIVMKQYQDTGIIVPYFNNEAHMFGYITTSTESSVDIYGHDAYPLGFDCENPDIWPEDGLPTDWLEQNNEFAPDSPYTIPEFQGGGFQHWGQAGFENCAALTNHEFERVLYKNNYGVGATIHNIYMVFGGTNWGNLGHAQGFTSYDYGAQITEERLVYREKYSEVKLQANFFHVSPAFLEADRFSGHLNYTDTEAITVTPATTDTTKFYISRHTVYDTIESVEYKLTVNTVKYGDITIPQNGGKLVLNRRDSKIHLSDYAVGDETLIYSSAEVFTWKKYDDKTVLVLYGGPNEHHEIAVEGEREGDDDDGVEVDGDEVNVDRHDDGYTVISWDISDDVEDRKVVKLGNFHIYLLNRNEAYNFWVPPTGADYGTSDLIVKAGYLVRTANRKGNVINLVGDVNATTPIEIIGGAPDKLKKLTFNGEDLKFKQAKDGVVTASVKFKEPKFKLPDLSKAKWKKIDSLPELSADYDDSDWVDADLEESYNDKYLSTTHVSLYVDDYGFHTGSVIFRGHFTANGKESTLNMTTAGGFGFGSSIWIGDKFLGSWDGIGDISRNTTISTLPKLTKGEEYILTVVIDYMGLNGNYVIGEDTIKEPRGIIDYILEGHEPEDVKWKLTGNLGGESYADLVRGPLNEGGFFIERQGYHQPGAPVKNWKSGNPAEKITKPGVTFYTTTVELDLPKGYDIPLGLKFDIDDVTGPTRAQIFVNGYQFGKFTSHIGPQWRFPVPEGILNHHGKNEIGVLVWAQGEEGTQLKGFDWDVAMITATGYGDIGLTPAPKWKKREAAY